MPERSGLDVLRTLRSRGDARPVVLLTGGLNDELAREAIQLSVNGIVIKATAPRDLLTCLESVVQGRRWLDQDVLQRVMGQAMSPDGPPAPLAGPSGRERAVPSLSRRGPRHHATGSASRRERAGRSVYAEEVAHTIKKKKIRI